MNSLSETVMFVLIKGNQFLISETYMKFLSRRRNHSFVKRIGVILLIILT